MRIKAYKYKISEEKYSARMTFFKYMTGVYSALIPFSIVGFEKLSHLFETYSIKHKSVEYLQNSMAWIGVALFCSIGVLALTYHLKFYYGVHMERHLLLYYNLKEANRGLLQRGLIRIELLIAHLEFLLMIIFAAIWSIPALIGAIYLVMAFYEIGK